MQSGNALKGRLPLNSIFCAVFCWEKSALQAVDTDYYRQNPVLSLELGSFASSLVLSLTEAKRKLNRD